ncbi:hypothetical protein GCM10010218_28240 [Streptomyces mashuensis]|uniref:Glycosyl hydrolase family 98 putative carbohydrate-binding module domain-containing protein n=1 Tax=Streptomyces mashuensis TaxID=33904 RepID=A0A919EBX8_9ACTN|nr:hypothetical protein GCM10010218_28240 [Streptomyces mashuensis]
MAARVGLLAGAVAAAGAIVAYALASGTGAPAGDLRARPTAAPVASATAPAPGPSLTASPAPTSPPALVAKAARATPTAGPTTAEPSPTPTPRPSTTPTPRPAPTPSPTPTPTPTTPRPANTAKPGPPPSGPPVVTVAHRLSELDYQGLGNGDEPEVRLYGSSWLWQRHGLRVAGTAYPHGVSVHSSSSVTIDLNRTCTSYDALAGVDDMTLGLGAATFSVYADGKRMWGSGLVRAGQAPVPVHVPLAGHRTLRLVVDSEAAMDRVAVADWALARISCIR